MVAIQFEYQGDLHCKAVHGPSGNRTQHRRPQGQSGPRRELLPHGLGRNRARHLHAHGDGHHGPYAEHRHCRDHGNSGKGNDNHTAKNDCQLERQNPRASLPQPREQTKARASCPHLPRAQKPSPRRPDAHRVHLGLSADKTSMGRSSQKCLASLHYDMRLVMVSQKTRQLKMQKTASRFVNRAVVLSRDCSARQPDLRIL
jgi:hypothetical protein